MSQDRITCVDDFKREIPRSIEKYQAIVGDPDVTKETKARAKEFLDMALAYQWVLDGCPDTPPKSYNERECRKIAKTVVNELEMQ